MTVDACVECGHVLVAGYAWCGRCGAPTAVLVARPTRPGDATPAGMTTLLAATTATATTASGTTLDELAREAADEVPGNRWRLLAVALAVLLATLGVAASRSPTADAPAAVEVPPAITVPRAAPPPVLLDDAGPAEVRVTTACARDVDWCAALPSGARTAALGADGLYVVVDDGVLALDPSTGEVRWERPIADGMSGWIVVHAGDDGDVVLVRDQLHTLRVVRGEDGTIAWTRRRAEQATVADGAVVTVEADGLVVARELADGSHRWTAEQLASTSARPVVHGDAVVLADGLRVRVLEAATGQERWAAPFASRRRVRMAVADDVVVLVERGGLLGRDLADGTVRWGPLGARSAERLLGVGPRVVLVASGHVEVRRAADGEREHDLPLVGAGPRHVALGPHGTVVLSTATAATLLDPAVGTTAPPVDVGAVLRGPAAATSGRLLLVGPDRVAAVDAAHAGPVFLRPVPAARGPRTQAS